eukprot:582888_1
MTRYCIIWLIFPWSIMSYISIIGTWNDKFEYNDNGNDGWNDIGNYCGIKGCPTPDNPLTQTSVNTYHGPYYSIGGDGEVPHYYLSQIFYCEYPSNVHISYKIASCDVDSEDGTRFYLNDDEKEHNSGGDAFNIKLSSDSEFTNLFCAGTWYYATKTWFNIMTITDPINQSFEPKWEFYMNAFDYYALYDISITCDGTANPTYDPTHDPTHDPTRNPTCDPTYDPTYDPSNGPTRNPTRDPTYDPSHSTQWPTRNPTDDPTENPILIPTFQSTYDLIFDSTDTSDVNRVNEREVDDVTTTTDDPRQKGYTPKDKETIKTVVVILVVLGVLSLCLCGLVCCYVRRYRTKKEGHKTSAQMMETRVPQTQPMPGHPDFNTNVLDIGEEESVDTGNVLTHDDKDGKAYDDTDDDVIEAVNETDRGDIVQLYDDYDDDMLQVMNETDMGNNVSGLIGNDEFVISGDDDNHQTGGGNTRQ